MHQSDNMQIINSDLEYNLTLKKIDRLLSKGSQGVTTAEMSEITALRRLASEYETVRYDRSRSEHNLAQAWEKKETAHLGGLSD